MKRTAFAVVVLSLLAGCGGGGGTIAGGGGQDVSIGSIQARAQSGQATPLIVDSFGSPSSFFAMSGATFTRVAYTPAKTLANTRIAFGRNGGNLWTADPTGNHLFEVTTDMNHGGFCAPTWSPDAFRILFQGLRSGYRYFVVGATGYGETQQLWNGALADIPAWSPTSNTVAFGAYDPGTGHNQIFTATVNGSATTTMITAGSVDLFAPCWNPTGSKIAVHSNGDGNLYTMNPNGSGMAALTGVSIGQALSAPAWSPDGSRIAATLFDGTHWQIAIVTMDGNYNAITSDTTDNSHPTWSPDGKKLAWAHRSAAGDLQIVVATADGSDPVTVLQKAGESYGNPSWSPFPVPRTMVGSGGLFGTGSKAGFIFSQNGDIVQSFLTFNAATPSTTTITSQTGSTNQTFNISGGGGINSLSYANDLLLAPITVIPASGFTTATGVIVSMNLVDGYISLTVPYTKMSGKVQSKSGGTVYTGQFLGVFDGSGKNLAPAGAARIELSSSGKFISAS